jgi:hypothetical protein
MPHFLLAGRAAQLPDPASASRRRLASGSGPWPGLIWRVMEGPWVPSTRRDEPGVADATAIAQAEKANTISRWRLIRNLLWTSCPLRPGWRPLHDRTAHDIGSLARRYHVKPTWRRASWHRHRNRLQAHHRRNQVSPHAGQSSYATPYPRHKLTGYRNHRPRRPRPEQRCFDSCALGLAGI